MKRLILSCMFFLIFVLSGTTDATILTDHFGITLSVDGGGNFNNLWAPTLNTSTANYVVADWATSGPPIPSGGEAFDVEAMYFDNDATYAYFAIVTSMPATGYPGSMFGWPTHYFNPGDIAIDINSGYPPASDFVYEYGIKTIGGSAGRIESGATWVYDQGSAGYPNGYPPQGATQYTKFNVGSGTHEGDATIFEYVNAGLTEKGWATWVIGAKVFLSDLGNPGNGTTLVTRFSPDCNNDLLFSPATLSGGNFDINMVVPVPEPSTLLLLGFGLMGAGIFGRRALKK